MKSNRINKNKINRDWKRPSADGLRVKKKKSLKIPVEEITFFILFRIKRK